MSTLHVVGAAIVQDGKCLVAQRGQAMSLAGKWEFPGGKVEAGESPTAALAREIAEELGLQVTVAQLLGAGTAKVGARTITLDVYAARVASGTLALREHARVTWASVDELERFDWAEADVPCVAPVKEWLRLGAPSDS
jgi:8-oxo-dGTP diphosphatase